jgi:hypothetical protein
MIIIAPPAAVPLVPEVPPAPLGLFLPALSPALQDETKNARTAKNLKHRMTNLRALRSQSQQGERAQPSVVEARNAPYTYHLSIRNKAFATRKNEVKHRYLPCISRPPEDHRLSRSVDLGKDRSLTMGRR